VIWAIVWFILFRDRPKQMKHISQQELSEIPRSAKPADTPPVPWRRLSRQHPAAGHRRRLRLRLGRVGVLHLDPVAARVGLQPDVAHYGLLTSFILVGGVVGDTLGGVLSDARLRRTGNARNARRHVPAHRLHRRRRVHGADSVHSPLVVAVVSLALAFFFSS